MKLLIKEIMDARGITSAYLASQIGISKVAVSNIVTGKSYRSLDTAVKIADVLHVSVSELIGEKEFERNVVVCPNCGAKLELNKKEE